WDGAGGDVGGKREEPAGALLGERHELAQDDTDGRLGEAAELVELRLALGAREVLQYGPQVAERHEGECLLLREVEDESEARLLGLVETEHLAEHDRAAPLDARAHRRPDAVSAARGARRGGGVGRRGAPG